MLKFVFSLILGLNLFLLYPVYFQKNTKKNLNTSNLLVIDKEIVKFLKKWNIPGASVALVKDERLVYAKSFGMADENNPTNPNHLYRIASLSKPITAVAIMKLAEEGKIRLEDFVFGDNGILKSSGFNKISDKRIYSIKVKHLLEHSAGWDRELSSCGDPMFDPINIATCMGIPPPADQNSIIKYMLTKDLDFAPGEKYSYSNFGYAVLGRIIEKVTHTTYEQYVKNTLLLPLGITTMKLGCSLIDNKEPNEVKYFTFPTESKVTSVFQLNEKVYKPYGGFNLEAMDAHGGWIASAPALAKFLVSTDGFPAKKDLLNNSSIKTMTKATGPNLNYAFGWFVNSKGNWWHTGSLIGSSSMIARLENGVSWVLLFNGNPMTSSFYNDMDKLMWRGISQIEDWPKYDLFNKYYPLNIEN